MNRRRVLASLAGSAAALAVAPALPAAVPPPDPRERPIPLRSWEVYEPVPALRLLPGDTVSEWVNTHEMNRHRGDTFAHLPAGSWPAFLAAVVEGAVEVCRFTPDADPSDFLDAGHEPERALELAWERQEAGVKAWAAKHSMRTVAW